MSDLTIYAAMWIIALALLGGACVQLYIYWRCSHE